jgi:hypothetical protein
LLKLRSTNKDFKRLWKISAANSEEAHTQVVLSKLYWMKNSLEQDMMN